MKVYMGSLAMSFIFSSFGMNNEEVKSEKHKDEKIKKFLIIKSKIIDRSYETIVKNFWQELTEKKVETEWKDKKNTRYYKENDDYFIMYMTWPSQQNIVYTLNKCKESSYEDMTKFCNKGNTFIFLDATDSCSLCELGKFLKKEVVPYSNRQYIMEGSRDKVQKKLEKSSQGLSDFTVQPVKSQSFKNLKLDVGDKEAWLEMFFDDEPVDKNKKELNYLLNCPNVKIFLGTCWFELFKRSVPVATTMTYTTKDTITIFSAYEKIKDKVTLASKELNINKTIKIDESYRKKMLFEALKNASESVKNVNIAVPKEDKKFFESIGMKKIRRLNQYNF